ncbi:MAG: hypothetical protein FRX49_08878 [Trebouxia sp. A1-2]|nr:MAG: hypothetical protein FRX49_08878 [Trebouxia sp. A1-2]
MPTNNKIKNTPKNPKSDATLQDVGKQGITWGDCLSSAGLLSELPASGWPADLFASGSTVSLQTQCNINRPTDARQRPFLEEPYQRQSQKTCDRTFTMKLAAR